MLHVLARKHTRKGRTKVGTPCLGDQRSRLFCFVNSKKDEAGRLDEPCSPNYSLQKCVYSLCIPRGEKID